MPWTAEETTQFQIDNNKYLAEVNATLRPDLDLNAGKVGIFLPGQAGDLATAMGVLKYRNEIFPGKQIIWFANMPNADLLRYAPISEVRPYPWAGNGLPAGTPDFWPLLCNNQNRLNVELAKQYELTADLDDGYFPAPYMLAPENRHNIDYPNVSRKVFGVAPDIAWHPYLSFSDEERQKANEFIELIGSGKRILIETFAGSGQSILDEEMIGTAMTKCNELFGKCKFIFTSHKFLRHHPEWPAWLFEKPDVHSCADFTVRQTSLIASHCDLMISVSSGITVAASCWYNKPLPIIQFCGSFICSTQSLANGPFELVTADERTLDAAKQEFYDKLAKLLIQHK